MYRLLIVSNLTYLIQNLVESVALSKRNILSLLAVLPPEPTLISFCSLGIPLLDPVCKIQMKCPGPLLPLQNFGFALETDA